jgi:hypothetical protein
VDIDGPDISVMDGSVMLGEVVGKIVVAGVPENVELAFLDNSFADPVVAHVNVSRLVLLDDGVVCETGGGGVAGLNRSGRLWVAHVMKDLTED